MISLPVPPCFINGRIWTIESDVGRGMPGRPKETRAGRAPHRVLEDQGETCSR